MRSLGIYAAEFLFLGWLAKWPLLSIAFALVLSLLLVRALELTPLTAFLFLGRRWPDGRPASIGYVLSRFMVAGAAAALLVLLFRQEAKLYKFVLLAAIVGIVAALELSRRFQASAAVEQPSDDPRVGPG